jgi:acid phosphatase class B
MKIRASLIPNPYYETTKTKTKTWHVQNKNPIRFYCKKETKQGYDKKMYLKIGVE